MMSKEKQHEDYIITKAVDKAIDDLPKNFTIANFISANRETVKQMLIDEFNEEKHLEDARMAGKVRALVLFIINGTFTIEEASEKVNMTVTEFKEYMYQNEENNRIRSAEHDGKLDLIIELVNDGSCPLHTAAYYANMKVNEFEELLKRRENNI